MSVFSCMWRFIIIGQGQHGDIEGVDLWAKLVPSPICYIPPIPKRKPKSKIHWWFWYFMVMRQQYQKYQDHKNWYRRPAWKPWRLWSMRKLPPFPLYSNSNLSNEAWGKKERKKLSDFDKFICDCLFSLEWFPSVFARDGRKVIGFDWTVNKFPAKAKFFQKTGTYISSALLEFQRFEAPL